MGLVPVCIEYTVLSFHLSYFVSDCNVFRSLSVTWFQIVLRTCADMDLDISRNNMVKTDYRSDILNPIRKLRDLMYDINVLTK